MKSINNIVFSYMYMCWCCCAFCNGFGNDDTSQEIYMSTNHSISSFVCIPYIGAFFIHKSPWSCSFPWFQNLMMKKNQKYTQNIKIFWDKVAKIRCSMILISCTCDRVNLHQFCYMNILEGLIFYLGDLILKHVMCVKL